MKIKTTAWLPHIHSIRKDELELVFKNCPKKLFRSGLELGAGDFFQTSLLVDYVINLVSTEYNSYRLKCKKNTSSITFRRCDAENVAREFKGSSFDFVFSSNVLEHIPNPGKMLRGISSVLSENGVTIHVIPSPFFKLCHLLLYIPHRLVSFLEIITKKSGGLRSVLYKLTKQDQDVYRDNLKVSRPAKLFFYRLLLPEPHGVSNGHLLEFYAFSKRRWVDEFERAHLHLINVIKGPVFSGYGFGLGLIRNFLSLVGIASEYIYVAVKRPDSKYRSFFESH